VLVAGQQGVQDSTGDTLSYVRFFHLDEDHGLIYISDSGNNRIQQFIIGGSGTGVTVAGNTIAETGLNQLNDLVGI
jgi:hypothetical protein